MVKFKKISKTDLAKINQQILEDMELHQKVIQNLAYDIPLSALCLPENINKILIKCKITRVLDLLIIDYKNIKGIGEEKAKIITQALQLVIVC